MISKGQVQKFTVSSMFNFRYKLIKTGNINAPEAVTFSAIIYCLRCLIDEDIPLNQGCLKPIHVKIPKGSLLSPSDGAAVVGGNVLTVGQRIARKITATYL